MLEDSKAFSGFSVDDLDAAAKFYSETLGVKVKKQEMGLELQLGTGASVFIYEKADHSPASFTILNFPVDDIDAAVAQLKSKGVEFIQYKDLTDENNIARGIAAKMGPDIAWFKDPAGNYLSVLHEA